MKVFGVTVIVLVAACALARADEDSASSEELLQSVKSQHLRDLIKEHGFLQQAQGKFESACPGKLDDIKKAIVEFRKCDDRVDDSLTLCETIHTSTLNCTKPILDVLDTCLPEENRGLPDLLMKSVVAAVDYLCKAKGETILELVNPCLMEDPPSDNEEWDKCEHQLKEKSKAWKTGTNEVPRPRDLCSFATTLRSCLEVRSKATCKNQKTKDAVLGFVDASFAPCSTLNETQ